MIADQAEFETPSYFSPRFSAKATFTMTMHLPPNWLPLLLIDDEA